ncbi:MAG: FkbM family methyltransferase [Mesorhizobium sp.]|nr:MAG: FkbM family methyltransferase [Mesorhizobium sp.]
MKQIRGIWLPKTDTHMESHLVRDPLVDGKGTYQFRKYDKARSHVKRFGHAVDIGAQIGLWSRVLALDFEHVTSFEPLPLHHACFERNVTSQNVTLHRTALADKASDVTICTPAATTGNSHVAGPGETSGQVVEARTLDSFGLTGIDFLKIDVEGFEYFILKGAEETIRREKPVIIVEQKPNNAERYGRGQHEALALLKSWGGKELWVMSGDHLVVF